MSYSTGRNVKSFISSHNKSILRNKPEMTKRPCNCRKDPCPVGGDCGISGVTYRADVQSEEPKNVTKEMFYTGQTSRCFKQRYVEHKNSFSTPQKVLNRNEKEVQIEEQIEEKKCRSELANYVWELKENKKKFSIKWQILKKAFPHRNGQRYCDLCANEKTSISLSDPAKSLNSRNEIYQKCRSKIDSINRNCVFKIIT